MSRDWTEFVQSQHIPWTETTLLDVDGVVETKILSSDPVTGACSLLVRYPAGFSGQARRLAVDEEFLVLDGALVIGDTTYSHLGYAHLPAGFGTGDRSTATGAVVLTFYSATPQISNQAVSYDESRLVWGLSAYDVPYTGNFHPEFPPGAGRKLLYQDPATGDTTWILGTMPLRWVERSEVHPFVEEMYLLSGEVHGDRGIFRPGAYFWRPENKVHGPYGTLTGNLYFFRTKGGPLKTDYVDAETKFHWWPSHKPVLPDALLPFGSPTADGPACF